MNAQSELTKLAKVLSLTTSPNDNEALASIRMANKTLLKLGITWPQILQEKTIVIHEQTPLPQPQTQPKPNSSQQDSTMASKIDEMFRVVTSRTNLQRMNVSSQAFIKSLEDFYNTRGMLTSKQLMSLRKFYDNI